MSILIKGMKMPTKENAVILITPSGDVWMIGDMPNEDTHLVKAKAVPVPEPHGRCIDADVLAERHRIFAYEHKNSYSFHIAAKAYIDNAPTIIEAEDGDGE